MSFLEQLKEWSKPAPVLPDLESNDAECGKLVERGEDNFEQTELVTRPKFRRGLELTDEKYKGSKVSRSDIFEDSNEVDDLEPVDDLDLQFEDAEVDGASDDEDEMDEDEDKEGDMLSSKRRISKKIDSSDGEDDEDEEDGEDEEDDEDDEDDEHDNDEGDVDDEDDQEEEPSAKRPKVKDIMRTLEKEKELKKANDVADQLKIWDQVLFLKIKMQAAMRAFNQLPRGKLATELLASADEETKNSFKLARSNIKRLLLNLLESEKKLVDGSVQCKGALEGLNADGSDDDEILSSEDEKDDDGNEDEEVGDEEEDDGEDEGDESKIKGNAKEVGQKSMNWKKVEKLLEEREKNFTKFRNQTIKKWDNRTKLFAFNQKQLKNDFSAFQTSEGVVEQISKIMSDHTKQRRRFHIKRAEGDRIGGEEAAEEDEEIFDDDDFNEVLLKELIDKKTRSLNDPVAMTRHYLEMKKHQVKRCKKRIHDKSLVKDRSIKYVPIPALLNFHPSRPELVKWTHESRNELFRSLFK